jgi:hypothetical protein
MRLEMTSERIASLPEALAALEARLEELAPDALRRALGG